MKKLLLGTTALIGALAFAGESSAQQTNTRAPFTVTIGGGFNSTFMAISGDDTPRVNNAVRSDINRKAYDAKVEYSIDITAQARADNGLTYGALVRLSPDNVGGDQPNTLHDRAGVFAQGSFGRFEFGDLNSVRSIRAAGFTSYGPQRRNTLGPDGGLPQPLYNGANNAIPATTTTASTVGTVAPSVVTVQTTTATTTASVNATSTTVTPAAVTTLAASSPGAYTSVGIGPTLGVSSSSRRTKITYLTPTFSGFRAGASYTPGADAGGGLNGAGSDGFDRADTFTPALNQSAIGGRGFYRDVTELGASYTTTFDGFKLDGSFNWIHGFKRQSNTAGLTVEDGDGIFFGLRGEYMGFMLGGGVSYNFKAGLLKGTGVVHKDSTYGFHIGGEYVTGPWTVGGWYQFVNAEGNQQAAFGGNDKLSIIELGAGYRLAPGLELFTAVHYFDFKDEDITKRTGTIFMVGTTVNF